MQHVINAFSKMKERNWDCIYMAIDAHGTFLKPTYKKDSVFKFYDGSENVLKYLSTRKDIKLILFTSSHTEYISNLLNELVSRGIYFDYVNENPEIESDKISCFETKFYFDVLLDDKAGFNPETDWSRLLDTVEQYHL